MLHAHDVRQAVEAACTIFRCGQKVFDKELPDDEVDRGEGDDKDPDQPQRPCP